MSNDLQQKLSRFEADPPKEVWNKIAEALDAGEESVFPQRLLNYEEQPPAHTWNKIETSLDEEEPAIKVVPITRFKKPLRYIAAAASIVAIVLLANNLTNKRTGAGAVIGGTGTENVTVTKPVQSSVLPLDEPSVVNTPLPAEKEPVGFINSNREEATASLGTPRRAVTFIRPQNIFRTIAFSQGFVPQHAGNSHPLDLSMADDYMVYSDEDGFALRVPKKFFDLVYCKDGDDLCKERIRQLQKKMASTATTTDFGGVLEILRQLQ